MRKNFPILFLLVAGCSSVPAELTFVRASRFIIEPSAPAIRADVFIYDKNAPALRASRFVLDQ